MAILQLMHMVRYLLRAMLGEYAASCLEEDAALVVLLIDKVYGDARLSLAGGYYCLMYVGAIHAGTSILGEQGRVYIDDATCKGLYQRLGYQP